MAKSPKRNKVADAFADEICDSIKNVCGARPNDLFRTECYAIGLLVDRGGTDRDKAIDGLMRRFVENVTQASSKRKE